MKYLMVFVIACGLAAGTAAWAGGSAPPKPSAKDKCPVCGMFVAKYPDFLASIGYKDGTWVYFDGAKDMFKYYLNMAKYDPSRQTSDIISIYVTDYYTLSPVKALGATYIIGSDIYGPMGRELIPFEKEDDAREFMRDHHGQSLVRFGAVNLSLVKSLD